MAHVPFQIVDDETSLDVYVVIFNDTGAFVFDSSTSQYIAYAGVIDPNSYGISLTENATRTGYYEKYIPLPDGSFQVEVWKHDASSGNSAGAATYNRTTDTLMKTDVFTVRDGFEYTQDSVGQDARDSALRKSTQKALETLLNNRNRKI